MSVKITCCEHCFGLLILFDLCQSKGSLTALCADVSYFIDLQCQGNGSRNVLSRLHTSSATAEVT